MTTQQREKMALQVHRVQDDSGDDLGVVETVPTLTLVFEAIRDMHNVGTEPTRERIVEMTGLPGTKVDDRIKRLGREGMTTSEKARYEPVHKHAPARPMSLTLADDGIGKLEVGDDMLTLNPAELRKAGLLLQGFAGQVVSIGKYEELREELQELARKNRKLERAVTVKLSKAGQDGTQSSLL